MMNLQDEITKAQHVIKEQVDYIETIKEMQAKELAKPKSKRALFIHKNVFCVSSCGEAFTHGFIGMVENDNAFIDEESAQLQAQRNTLVYRMRVAALECPVDWNDGKDKYFLSWGCDNKKTIIQYAQVVRRSQLPHFACYARLKNFMNSLSTDEQKLLICGVE
jgi:hypothetical protein